MTKRNEFSHRRAELRARLLTGLANRAFSFRTSGLDGLAKWLLSRNTRSRSNRATSQAEKQP